MFFRYNTALAPPYQVLTDTNFINFSIQNKIELVKGMMDCLYAKCTVCVTDCVMAELEKLGPKYRIALRYTKPILMFSLHRDCDGLRLTLDCLIIPLPELREIHALKECRVRIKEHTRTTVLWLGLCRYKV
jgi:hypothetical protein